MDPTEAEGGTTYERTLEKSLDGDITNPSAELDHEIKC